MRAPTCQKATEIRYRTPGAHPDTSFDPKEELWSFAFWLLRHRHVHNYMLIYLATTLFLNEIETFDSHFIEASCYYWGGFKFSSGSPLRNTCKDVFFLGSRL